MLSSKLHIKLNPQETHLITSVAKLMRIRPEDLAKQVTLDASRVIMEQLREKAREMAAREAEEMAMKEAGEKTSEVTETAGSSSAIANASMESSSI